MLALSAAAVAILLAIASEMHDIRNQPPAATGLHVTLAAVTILLAWFFMNTIFALHYAHFFYGDSDAAAGAEARGLAFPGRAEPDYWDFLYFSFVIGMTFQVSDVQIENQPLRRIALAHGVLAFLLQRRGPGPHHQYHRRPAIKDEMDPRFWSTFTIICVVHKSLKKRWRGFDDSVG